MQQDEDEMKADLRDRATQARPMAGETGAEKPIEFAGLVSPLVPIRGRVCAENLEQVFTYHAPRNGREIVAYAEIRARAMDLAETILRFAPPSADQQAAIRKVREAVMTANAAVATQGAV